MLSLTKSAIFGLANVTLPGTLPNHLKVLSAGVKFKIDFQFKRSPDFGDVELPERPKLPVIQRAPGREVKKEPKRLRDIQGPTKTGNTFIKGQYGILALGGGYLKYGHFEMMRLTINRKLDTKTSFAIWRVEAPEKPITRKGLGMRMGGGKGAIDHYVTPVKYGRLIVEIGGKLELAQIEPVLKQMAHNMPFPATVVSRESLEAMWQEEAERKANNQNPWTFEKIARSNMLGIRKVLSPFDLHNHGRFTGKFFNPGRV